MDENALVFLTGGGRSGKSLLGRCLAAHLRISRFFAPERDAKHGHDEGQYVQSVYPSNDALGNPGAFGWHPKARTDETHPLATEETRRHLLEAWRPYWDATCPFLLETSPPNVLRTRFLQAVFGQTYFIHVLRHPLAVSYETGDEWRGDERRFRVDELLEHWLFCNEQFIQDRPHLENTHVVNYEALVDRPQATLNEIYAFLGVEPVPVAHEMKQCVNENSFRRWMRSSDRWGTFRYR
jgi:hypothetical protein